MQQDPLPPGEGEIGRAHSIDLRSWQLSVQFGIHPGPAELVGRNQYYDVNDSLLITSAVRIASFMAFMKKKAARKGMVRKRAKTRLKIKKKDPIFVDGVRPRPMYVDYKDVELLKKLINRHGKIVSRRKTGCTAISQHAVTTAIKRARFMALLPYVGE